MLVHDMKLRRYSKLNCGQFSSLNIQQGNDLVSGKIMKRHIWPRFVAVSGDWRCNVLSHFLEIIFISFLWLFHSFNQSTLPTSSKTSMIIELEKTL